MSILQLQLVDVWAIKSIPVEVMPADFRIFIQNKFEYSDPMGEHLYSPESIWMGCKYIIPPGEILESFNEVRQMLEEKKCDFFTLSDWKRLLGFSHLREDPVCILVLERKGFPETFLQCIKDAYEYRDPFGDHIYSRESIWLGMRDGPPGGNFMETFLSVWRKMDEHACSLFTLIDN